MDKKGRRILEAGECFGRNIVDFGAKEVDLISNLAIIAKGIHYISIYLLFMSSLLCDIYDRYLLTFS